MIQQHWKNAPLATLSEAPLAYRAAEYERMQAERDFMQARGAEAETLAGRYMEAAWIAEGDRHAECGDEYAALVRYEFDDGIEEL